MNVKVAQSKGEVFLCCLGRLKSVPRDNNFVFLVTRGKRSIDGVRQTTELAPSKDLFYKYTNLWKKSSENWWHLYEKQYLDELDLSFIDKLREGLDSGKNITLVCFCGDETRCHRSILKKLFTELNYETISY